MVLKRTLAVAERNLRQLSHDRRTIILIVFLPLLVMILFGYVFGGEVTNVHVTYVNLDPNEITSTLHEELLKDGTLSILELNSISEAEGMVRGGKAWAAIIIPSNFTTEVKFGNLTQTLINGSLVTYIDASNVQVASVILEKTNTALRNTLEFYLGEAPVKVNVRYVYGENINFLDAFAPAIIGLSVQLLTTMLPLVSLVRERTQGTLERLMASPLGRSEIVFGYVLSFALLGLIQSSIIIVVGVFVFGITVKGNLLLVFALITLFAVGSLGLGILLSTISKNEFQALQFVPFTYIPAIILSGMLIPLESIPYPFNYLSYGIPLTYLIDLLRSIMVRQTVLSSAPLDFAALVAFACITILGSIFAFRREAE